MKTINWNENSLIPQRPVSHNSELELSVAVILKDVKKNQDSALKRMTEKFDRVLLSDLKVSPDEITFASSQINEQTKKTLRTAIDRIKLYQSTTQPSISTLNTDDGIECQRVPRPIDSVGLYVPGGSAPLVSTLMMLAIPAQIAGCKKIIVTTPPEKDGSINPALLYTAKQCGITEIYKVGGAQAIGAMAYGTESIPKVNKIYGPGNAWVTEAKKQIAQDTEACGIDMPAGPSEVLVIADDSAKPDWVAADLLAQAEHGPDSQVILITTSKGLIDATRNELDQQLNKLPRFDIAKKALEYAQLIYVESLDKAIEISNQYAPEHLMLQVNDPEKYIDSISNAGAVFVGHYAPETLGDYVNGSNHVLPTEGYAKYVSGLSVNDFIKFISIQRVEKQGLLSVGNIAVEIAALEGLQAHANAVTIRLNSIAESSEE